MPPGDNYVRTTEVAPDSRLRLLDREQLEVLLELSQEFNATVDVQALLHQILDLMVRVTDAEAGTLWIAEGERVRCNHAVGPAASLLAGASVSLGQGAAGMAVATGRSSLVGNALEDDHFRDYRIGSFRTRSAVTIPLVSRGVVLGAVQLVNDEGGKDEFDEKDVAFLEVLADDAAAALRKAQLLDAERRARNLRALIDVSNEITATFDTGRILLSIVNLAARAVQFQRCVLALREGAGVRVAAVSGQAEVDRSSEDIRRTEEFLLWVAERGGPLHLPDVSAGDEPAPQVRRAFGEYLTGAKAAGLLVLPVADAEGELGVLLFEFAEPDALDQWGRESVELLAAQSALALRNAQLYRDVPFISWLEPLAERRRALMRLPGATLLRWLGVVLASLLILTLVHIPLRIGTAAADVRSAVQRPVRTAAGGIIEEVHVRSGDVVAAGQQVATLRNDELAARIRELRGDLQVSQRAALAAEARGNAGQAAAERARSTGIASVLDVLQQESATLRVLAPTAGVVLTPRLEDRLGEHRQPGEPVMWIGDAAWAELDLRVRQGDIGAVREGQRVRARVSAHPEILFEATVVAVAPMAEGSGSDALYTVRALVNNEAALLRTGMEARARILGDKVPLGTWIFRRPWRWARLNLWW
jgi:GAF domain-containing protein/multidrug resistance efflux pump